MQYVKVTFVTSDQEGSDMLMALLADAGYDGFEEDGNKLYAYIDQPKFHEDELRSVSKLLGVDYELEIIPAQNWNALWESNFPPVVVPGFCTIRAHFHDMEVSTPYEIIITPKMSFGTGHHATTQLMMQLMSGLELAGKKVLDFGTGTGVLAILAEKLGATDILAIDNDEWPVENAIENAARNQCEHITVRLGSLEAIEPYHCEVILANINRHILLHYMTSLYETLNSGGKLLMSGLLAEDNDIIREAAEAAGFQFIEIMEQSNWIALSFKKA